MEPKVCQLQHPRIKRIKTPKSEFVFCSERSYNLTINTHYALIRARNDLHDSRTQTELQTRPPSLKHLPLLSKSSFSPFFSLHQPAFSKLLPANWRTSSPQQQCAAIAMQLPMHRTWDFHLQYATVHYSAHYMQRASPMLERTPCRKFLHRSRNFKVYTLLVTAFLFFSLRDNITVSSL